MYIHACTHAHKHTRTRVHMHTHSLSFSLSLSLSLSHTHTHTHTHPHTHTHRTHTTQTYVCTHTHSLSLLLALSHEDLPIHVTYTDENISTCLTKKRYTFTSHFPRRHTLSLKNMSTCHTEKDTHSRHMFHEEIHSLAQICLHVTQRMIHIRVIFSTKKYTLSHKDIPIHVTYIFSFLMNTKGIASLLVTQTYTLATCIYACV